MRRLIWQFGLTLVGLIVSTVVLSQSAAAADYTQSHLMDDAIFDNVGAMSEQQIRTFITSRPTSCLATSGAIFPEPQTYWQYGANVDAARVIYQAATYNDLNPQVILATLQKEQSLVTRTNCFDGSIDVRNKAMGQGCPDNGPCPAPAYAGFHQQVMKGAWQLKFNKERANGNVGWGDNGSIVYGGPWTEGNRAGCTSCQSIYRDGYWTIDGQSIKLETGATASFYRYTPHLGQALPGIFESFFGSVIAARYASQYAGQSPYPTVIAGSAATVTFSYQNIGNQAWYDDITAAGASAQPVHLATSHSLNRPSVFGSTWGGDKNRSAGVFAAVYEADGTTLAANQHVTQPRQIAKFSFSMKAPSTLAAGVYREFFQPVIENTAGGSMNDPWTFLDVTVRPAIYGSAYVDQSPYPTLLQGQSATVWFKYKNTGNQTWYDNTSAPGANALPIHLATTHHINRVSAFGTPWGGDRNRSAGWFDAVYEANGTTLAANQHTATPGQIVKFSFPMAAPANLAPGNYREFFQPIVEGFSIMNDPWTFLDVRVQSASYGSAYVDQSPYPTINRGSSATVWFKYKNTGNVAWYDNVGAAAAGKLPLHLATTHPINRPSIFGTPWGGDRNRSSGLFEAVYEANGTTLAANQHVAQPGQIIKMSFPMAVPANATPGVYREFFQPIIEGFTVMNDPWTFLDVRVQ